MTKRTPLRKENLQDLVNEFLDRLDELSDKQLNDIAYYAERELFDRDIQRSEDKDDKYFSSTNEHGGN